MATKKQENAKIKKVKFVSIPDLCNVCNKNLSLSLLLSIQCSISDVSSVCSPDYYIAPN